MSGAVQAVSDVVHNVTAPIIDPVVDTVSHVSDVIAKDPILSTGAAIALTAAGVPAPLSGALVAANAGASPENIAKAAALGYVGGEIAQNVAPEVAAATDSKVLGQIAGQAAGSAGTAALTGRDPIQAATNALVTGGINAGTNEVLGQVEGYGDLTPTQQKAVSAAVSAELQGKDPTAALIQGAINIGKEKVQDEIKYAKYEDMNFDVNQGAVDKVAEMEAGEQETLPAIEPPTEPSNTYGLWTQPLLPGTPRPQVTSNFRPVDANEFWTPPTNPTTTEPQTEPPVEVPGEGGGTLTVDPKTGGVTVTEPELPNTEPPEEWTPPTDLPPPTTSTGIDNEGADLGGGDVFNLDEFYRSIGIDPSTMKDEPPMSQDDIDAIIRGENVPIETPTGTVNVFKGKVVPTTPAPKPTTPTNQPTTQPVTQPTTQPVAQPAQQNNPLGMLALLDILGQSQQQPQAPQPVQGADIRLMEDIFGTNFITPRPEGTKKYSSGGEIEALLQLLRS